MTLPTPFYEREGIRIYVGDNREVLPRLDTESVSAVVSDPPSGISFMNANWDSHKGGRDQWIAWLASVLSECNRVMLPGAHALIWALPRTSGWTSMAIEDAGLDVRDCITHLFGSGFPKSHDVSKAIDKAAGAEREVISREVSRFTATGRNERYGKLDYFETDEKGREIRETTAPATPEAEQWQGWGTALKPAAEFWYLARKPFKGTVAANVLAHGTGALNIDASRIPTTDTYSYPNGPGGCKSGEFHYQGRATTPAESHPSGRWPANVILDEAAAAMLDAQSGERKGRIGMTQHGSGTNSVYGTYARSDKSFTNDGVPDTGGASRFFKVVAHDLPIDQDGASRFAYIPKASRRERNAGLDGMPERATLRDGGRFHSGGRTMVDGVWRETGRAPQPKANTHPTVKPTQLMKYLIQMVTPPGGIILDPFMGSGSTLVAAAQLGFPAIGIELSEEYAEIAARRVDHMLEERDPQLALEGIA